MDFITDREIITQWSRVNSYPSMANNIRYTSTRNNRTFIRNDVSYRFYNARDSYLASMSFGTNGPIEKKDFVLLNDLKRTNRGDYTLLPLEIANSMGEPLDLDVQASITFDKKHLTPGPEWIGTRGTFSTVGSRHAPRVASSGSRMVFSCKNFSKVRTDYKTHAEYRFHYANGNIAAKPGNWFLYRQPLWIYNPALHTEPILVSYVGLASCMSWMYLYKAKLSPSALTQKVFMAHKPYANPFQRHNTSIHKGLNWTKKLWSKYSKQTVEDYASVKPQYYFISEMLAAQSVDSHPLGIKLAKAEHLLNDKVEDLLSLNERMERVDRAINRLNAQPEEYYTPEAKKEQLDTYVEKQSAIQSKIDANAKFCTNLNKSIKKMKSKLEVIKADVLEQAKGSKEYEDNLAKEGFVIDDVLYIGPDERMVSFRDNKNVVTDEAFKLTEVHMHTTKPIRIVFGNSSNHQKISGPHKIIVEFKNQSVAVNLGPLTPWSAVQCSEGSDYFKAYPHCSGIQLHSTSDVFEHAKEMIRHTVYTCMGELAATAYNGFAQNNPLYVVMAVKSFLQSVNPSDEWGKHYINLPTVEDNHKIGSYSQWKRNVCSDYYDNAKWFFAFNETNNSYVAMNRLTRKIVVGKCEIEENKTVNLISKKPIDRGSMDARMLLNLEDVTSTYARRVDYSDYLSLAYERRSYTYRPDFAVRIPKSPVPNT